MKRAVLCASILAFATLFLVSRGFSAERVLLIGDCFSSAPSELSGTLFNQIREELASIDVDFVPLGKESDTVCDWRKTLEKIRKPDAALDKETAQVKLELEQGADAIIILLGANDVLRPTIQTDMRFLPRSTDWNRVNLLYDISLYNREPGTLAWRDQFKRLIEELRQAVPNAKRIVVMFPETELRDLQKTELLKFGIKALAKEIEIDAINLGEIFENHFDAAKYTETSVAWETQEERAIKLFSWLVLLCAEGLNENADANTLQTESNVGSVALRASYAYCVSPTVVKSGRETEKIAWRKRAKTYYQTQVLKAFPSFTEPGFQANLDKQLSTTSLAQTVDDKILDEVNTRAIHIINLKTRAIEGTEPIGRLCRRTGKIKVETIAPKVEIIAPDEVENLGYGVARDDDKDNEFPLKISVPEELLPIKIKVKIGKIERSVELRNPQKRDLQPTYYVSPGHPLKENAQYNNIDDFPIEQALGAIDYLALQGKDPMETSLYSPIYGDQLIWEKYCGTADDPNAIDLTSFDPSNAYSGAYIIRYIDSYESRIATLKLSAKEGTTAIERVYFNGKQVFFGELKGSDSKRREVNVSIELKKGRNLLVARVDRALWASVVSFEIVR